MDSTVKYVLELKWDNPKTIWPIAECVQNSFSQLIEISMAIHQ